MAEHRRDDDGPGAITPQGHHPDHITAAAKQQAEPSSRMVANHPDVLPGLLDLSDERDQWHRLANDMWREGWQAAEQARAGDYGAGYYDGILGRKRFEHQLAEEAELELFRWGPRGREHFADPRPGDWPGGAEGIARTKAAWEKDGFSFPHWGPDWVHLSGQAVHWHKPCTAACYAYEPGWYRTADAIAIIETLPGDYSEALAELRSQARAGLGGAAA